jgi:hypothetical protein
MSSKRAPKRALSPVGLAAAREKAKKTRNSRRVGTATARELIRSELPMWMPELSLQMSNLPDSKTLREDPAYGQHLEDYPELPRQLEIRERLDRTELPPIDPDKLPTRPCNHWSRRSMARRCCNLAFTP